MKNKVFNPNLTISLVSWLALVSIFGIGFSSWSITSDPNTYAGLNAEVDTVLDVGNYLKLNTNKGDSNSGVCNLQYCNTGLVYEEEIGNKCDVKYFLYLDITHFSAEINWSSVNFTFTLSYKSYQSAFTLINSNLTTDFKYLNSTTTNYDSTSLTSGTLSNTISNNQVVSTYSATIDSSSSYLNFEIDYIFTASDYSTVLNNECKVTGKLFNLKASLSQGGNP